MERVDLHTYLINSLNEAEDKNVEDLKIREVFKLDPQDPSKVRDGSTGKVTEINDKKNYKKLLNLFSKGKNGWWIKPDGDHTYYVTNADLKKELENLNKSKSKTTNKTNDVKEYNVDKFKLMGRTLAYRSALGCAQYGDNFQALARDVLTDDSEYSISQLFEIEDLFNVAAALKTVNGIKNREQKNEEIVSKCNDTLADLENEGTRAETIKAIKKDYEKDFKNNYNLFEQAYKDGIKEQQKEMSKPEFEWKDPATGVKPTGAGKLAKWAGKGLANLGAVADKIGNSIPSQHNLENDLARLAVVGVKGMMLLSKGITKLSQFFGSKINLGRASFKKDNSKKKFNDVKKKTDDFLKEFNTWYKNKNNQNESYQLNEANETKERDKILKKFDDLMYSDVLPYYYYKLSIIVDSFENNDEKYILKETEEGWNTLNTPSGNITLIEDTTKLMSNLVDYVNKNLNTALVEFKDEPTKNILRAIPKDIQFNSNIDTNFKNWCDNLKTDTNIINFTSVYNNEVITQRFNKYIEILNYFKNTSSKLEELKGITPLKNAELEFKDPKKKIFVPGIIVKKETIDDETEEEQTEDTNDETNDELKSKLENITKELEELKNINGNSDKLVEIENLSKKLEDIDSKIQATYNDLWKIINTKDNKAEFDKYKVDEHTPMFQKIINVKAIMSKLGIMESVVLEEIKQLLLEDTNNKELDKVKKELKNLLDKKFEDSDLEKYDEIKDELNKLDGIQKEIKEKPELVLALKDEEVPEEIKKEQEKINSMVVKLSDHAKDNNFIKLIDTVADENKVYNEELKTYFEKYPEIKQKYINAANVLGGEINNQILPAIWLKNKLYVDAILSKKESVEWKQKRLLNLLTEADTTENYEELTKTALQLIDEDLENLMSSDKDVKVFKDLYTKWIEKVNNLIEEIKKANNEEVNKRLDELSKEDPLKKAAACVKAIEALAKKPEEDGKNQEG